MPKSKCDHENYEVSQCQNDDHSCSTLYLFCRDCKRVLKSFDGDYIAKLLMLIFELEKK